MSAPLPLIFKFAPLPGNKSKYTPQELLDYAAPRLTAESDISIAFFVSGSTMPTSDVGPWWNIGTNPGWYIFDSGTGLYVPMPLPQSSLKYILQAAAPDPAIYDVWVVLDGAGKAQDIRTYSGGAWHSVWEDTIALYPTTVQVNASIAAAIAAASQITYPFKVEKSAGQIITAGAGETQITWENEIYDPNTVFASNVFTAPVNGYYRFTINLRLDLTTGAPTGISIVPKLRKNGVLMAEYNDGNDSDTGGRTNLLAVDEQLTAGDVVDAVIEITTTGASTWTIYNSFWKTYFSGSLLQKI